MLSWFQNISLTKKFYLVFGIIVAGAAIGVVIGQITFARVQVGGKAYSGIVRNMQTAHNMELLRLNINLSRGRVATMLVENDREKKLEHIAVIREQTIGIDELFRQVEASLEGTDTAGALEDVKKAHETWEAIKETRDKEVIPLLLEGGKEKAREIGEGIQAERFKTMAEATQKADTKVKAGVTEVVGKVKAETDIIRWGYVAGSSIFIIFLVLASRFFSSTIISPIVTISRKSKAMAEGNFAADDVMVERRDEIGLMMQDFTTMSGKIREMVGNVKTGVMDLSSSSQELSGAADYLTKGVSSQTLQEQQIATSAEEMSQTITDIARNASVASESSADAMEIAESGKQITDTTVATMNEVNSSATELATMVKKLNNSVIEIGDIVTVIKDIADQTNLLALNAAIEAARAGEQGRGFAVVADEVRKLAERTIKATADISSKIGIVQTESEQTAKSMVESSKGVTKATGHIRNLNNVLQTIVESIQKVRDQITQIATAVDEQSAASEEVVRNIEMTFATSKEIEKMADNIRDQIERLSRVDDTLRKDVSGFVIEQI